MNKTTLLSLLLLSASTSAAFADNLATVPQDTSGLATDGTNVYWTEPAAGRVMRLAV